MKKKLLVGLAVSLCFAVGGNTASATTISIPLTTGDWHQPGLTWQAPGSLTSVGGNLQGSMTLAHPGSGWRYTATTNDTYNFQDATLKFKWKITGSSAYVQTYSGLMLPDNTTHLTHFTSKNGIDYRYTTNHSFGGSQYIISDQWLYSELTYSATGLTHAVAYDAYGSDGGNIISQASNQAWYTSYWDDLAAASFSFTIADNYSAAHAFQLAEITLTTPTPDPVPEPATMLLFGTGLAGLAGSRLRRKNKA